MSSRVFASEDRFLVSEIKALLEQYKIPCFIKNEYASSVIGEISPLDAWPEVWVTDSEWLPRSKKLIDEYQANREVGVSWSCDKCGESNDGSFEICWQCGTDPTSRA